MTPSLTPQQRAAFSDAMLDGIANALASLDADTRAVYLSAAAEDLSPADKADLSKRVDAALTRFAEAQ
jgi:2-phospho-L-lactate guanylyltransferase (CobY/MobA/RfbA family)